MSNPIQELVAVAVDDRNWRGIGISLVVIAAIFSLIGLAIFLLTPNAHDEDFGRYQVDLEDLIGRQYKPRLFNGTWISDNEFIYQQGNGNIAIYNCDTNETSKELIRSTILREHRVDQWSLSADRKHLLLATEARDVLKYGKVRKYKVFAVDTEIISDLEDIIKSGLDAIPDPMYVQYLKWTPKENSIILVMNNDIYYMTSVATAKLQRITKDGVPGLIYNGIGDWLYSELVSDNFIWISPKGDKIAFAAFDDTNVREYSISLYNQRPENGFLSPDIYVQRYPKAGQVNPMVSLIVADLTGGDISSQLQPLMPPDSIADKDHYLVDVSWESEESIAVLWTLRSQNSSVLARCSGVDNSWSCADRHLPLMSNIPMLKELASCILLTNGITFIRFPRPDSVQGTFFNVAVSTDKDTNMKYITHGNYDVTRLIRYDNATRTLYYQGTRADQPWSRHIYSTKYPSETKVSHCLTCDLDVDCNNYNMHLSPNNEYHVIECLGPKLPYSLLKTFRNDTTIPMQGWLLDDNSDLRETLKPKKVPKKKLLSIAINKSNRKFNMMVYIPPKSNPDEEEDEIPPKPVVFEAPSLEDQSISSTFGLDIGDYIASKLGFIYIKIDRDLMSFRSQREEPSNGRHFSSKEKQYYDDLLQAMQSVVEGGQVAHVDKRVVAIIGKGSSAYNALSTLAQEKGDFLDCAVAVSPITSWRYQNTITSEYLYGQPSNQENYALYETTGLISSKLTQLAAKKFHIIHGTADEVVHVQNTMMLVKALVAQSRIQNNKAEAGYSWHLYPDEGYRFQNGAQHHAYKSLGDYLQGCFDEIRRRDLVVK
ncbi:Inactive dipeptidyl peptidase 10 [Halotydeus destructor]|nr:Inactive dipeptidyl peptidase 10 [Halotydeus destructor]